MPNILQNQQDSQISDTKIEFLKQIADRTHSFFIKNISFYLIKCSPTHKNILFNCISTYLGKSLFELNAIN